MSAGFYKLDLQNGGLLYAQNFIAGPGFSVSKDSSAEEKAVEYSGWKWFDNDVDAYTYYNITPTSQPWVVSSMTFKIALETKGMLTDINAYIATQPVTTQIAWSNAYQIQRNSPLLKTISTSLGYDATTIDTVFKIADEINV